MSSWAKAPAPPLPLPPHRHLTGWRDPFLVGRPGDAHGHGKWTLLLGAGHRAGGGEGHGDDGQEPQQQAQHRGAAAVGTALVYTSDEGPTSGKLKEEGGRRSLARGGAPLPCARNWCASQGADRRAKAGFLVGRWVRRRRVALRGRAVPRRRRHV